MTTARKRQGPSVGSAGAPGKARSGRNQTKGNLDPNCAASNHDERDGGAKPGANGAGKSRRHDGPTPTLDAYARRIHAKRLNFRHYVIEEREENTDGSMGYPRHRASLRLHFDPITQSAELAFHGDPTLEPTEFELSAILEEFVAATINGKIPSPLPSTRASAEEQRRKLNVAAENWTPFFLPSSGKKGRDCIVERDKVVMCEERRVLADGSKYCVPWSSWNDGKWYQMEPYGPLPPCWPEKHSSKFIMVHEGPSKAAFLEAMLRGQSDEAITWRASHPWAEELAQYEHVGMAGGAIAGPNRTDWDPLRKSKPSRVVYVCDNDDVGIRALPMVSKAYGQDLFGVMFDGRWPPSFDLKDNFPAGMFKERLLTDSAGSTRTDRRYVGPRLSEMLQPATWATDRQTLPAVGQGRPKTVISLRANFARQWVYTKQDPPIYIHRELPHLRYTNINVAVRKFSDGNVSMALQQHAFEVEFAVVLAWSANRHY